jgi:hypothetical protein
MELLEQMGSINRSAKSLAIIAINFTATKYFKTLVMGSAPEDIMQKNYSQKLGNRL